MDLGVFILLIRQMVTKEKKTRANTNIVRKTLIIIEIVQGKDDEPHRKTRGTVGGLISLKRS